eukprot:250368-Alexandrium_andersonii.AAC.1
MSASLVGSEMCIRDSPCGVESLPVGVLTLGGGWSAHAAGAGSLLPPVSYTHLTLPTICSV